MPSANRRLLDAAIRHAHGLEGLKNSEARTALKLLRDAVEPDLWKQLNALPDSFSANGRRLRATHAAIRELMDDAHRVAFGRAKTTGERLSLLESRWQINSLKAAAPQVSFTAPSEAVLRAVVTERPFDGALLRDWYESLGKRQAERVSRAINIGLVEGQPVRDIVNRLRGTADEPGILKIGYRQAESVVRTAVNHVTNAARELTFEENPAVKRVQLVATLDSRTTLICMGYDGKIYPVGDGPRPPFHMGCRTTVVPVLGGWEELGLKTPTASTRASMTGEVSERQTYGTWLKSQPKAVQDEALGPARAELFRRGDVKIDRFTNNGRELTLEQLAKRERVKL